MQQSESVQKLANLGHNLAAMEHYYENIVSGCQGDSACIANMMNQKVSTIPGYKESILPLPSGMTNQNMLTSISLGLARNQQQDDKKAYTDLKYYNWIGHNYIDQLDSVLADSSIDQQTKDLISELSWDIGMMATSFEGNTQALFDNTADQGNCYIQSFDIITGEWYTVNQSPTYEDYKNYNASEITHFDSALICASGKNQDENNMCH